MIEPSSRAGSAPSGYRLPESARPGAVQLQVADLDRSLGFYESLLGFRVMDRADGAVRLGTGEDYWIELLERPGAKTVRGVLGLFHVAYLLPDRSHLGQILRHLLEQGVRPGMSDHLVSEALYLSDPDGLGVEIYADRARSTWTLRGKELAMATEPLDFRDLLAAAPDEPWAGMPSSARVGHVHLHVGNLDRASAFYHDGVGLDRVVWSYPGALFLSAGGYHHHLGVNTWAGSSRSAGEGDARLLAWSLVVPEAAEAVQSLEASGYSVERDDEGWIAPDPWGTRLRLKDPS